jgi:hypothetical protein
MCFKWSLQRSKTQVSLYLFLCIRTGVFQFSWAVWDAIHSMIWLSWNCYEQCLLNWNLQEKIITFWYLQRMNLKLLLLVNEIILILLYFHFKIQTWLVYTFGFICIDVVYLHNKLNTCLWTKQVWVSYLKSVYSWTVGGGICEMFTKCLIYNKFIYLFIYYRLKAMWPKFLFQKLLGATVVQMSTDIWNKES